MRLSLANNSTNKQNIIEKHEKKLDVFVEKYHKPMMDNLDEYIKINKLFDFEMNEHKLCQLTKSSLNVLSNKLFGDALECKNGIGLNNQLLFENASKMIMSAINCSKNIATIAALATQEWNKTGMYFNFFFFCLVDIDAMGIENKNTNNNNSDNEEIWVKAKLISITIKKHLNTIMIQKNWLLQFEIN